MSEHMVHIKNVTNVTQRYTKINVNVTKQNIASIEIPATEFQTKCMKLFINMLSITYSVLKSITHQRISTSKSFGAGPSLVLSQKLDKSLHELYS